MIDGFQSGGANSATMTAPLHGCQDLCLVSKWVK